MAQYKSLEPTVSPLGSGTVTVSLIAKTRNLQTSTRKIELTIVSRTCSAINASEFATFFKNELAATEGLMLVIIEGWSDFIPTMLAPSFDALPEFLVAALFPTFEGASKRAAIAPNFGGGGQELTFALDNVCLTEESFNEVNEDVRKPHRIPIAAWIKPQGGISFESDRPLAVVMGHSGNNLLAELSKHYAEHDCKRFTRMVDCAYWLFADIFHLFTRWDAVLKASQATLAEAEHNSIGRKLPVIQRTRYLHQFMARLIRLTEDLRIQSTAVNVLHQALLKPHFISIEPLMQRLESNKTILEHYSASCQVMKEQTQNLMNLEFNTETVLQTQAVARLSALAFIFIPLSYISSIWGFTALELDPLYYPAAALPLLALTITCALFSRKLISLWETRGSIPKQSSTLMPTPAMSYINPLAHLSQIEVKDGVRRYSFNVPTLSTLQSSSSAYDYQHYNRPSSPPSSGLHPSSVSYTYPNTNIPYTWFPGGYTSNNAQHYSASNRYNRPPSPQPNYNMSNYQFTPEPSYQTPPFAMQHYVVTSTSKNPQN
ncbi:hypothetical protein H2198_000639 [Neophaeococcomyces mojaviensis]|uniref:Uncharacterized protein n=1 Tax=Neophaeococcomyces mojaviensis TaxID=3383035 RepID=A0ACC3AJG7_9EURO|nr:hypothetical protein H2198_000639 [Knufia sp. JES_112]